MAFLIILTYFIIGYVLSLLCYVYYCKDYQKQYISTRGTWEKYYRKEGVEGYMVFVSLSWPLALIILLGYCLFRYPFDCIKERNGIR